MLRLVREFAFELLREKLNDPRPQAARCGSVRPTPLSQTDSSIPSALESVTMK